MVVSTTGILLNYISLFYKVLQECLCSCLHVNYIVYKQFITQVHNWPLKSEVSDTYLLGTERNMQNTF